ncbi:MAG: DUF1704 domain-containing protein [Candidatus Tantalella remota]|nr:DUF1704 domain-containing protein [Candidatus Tantalella remota]
MDIYEVDKQISEMSGEIDFYTLLTPVNKKQEEEKFFSALQRGDVYNPVFEYCDRRLEWTVEPFEAMRLALGSGGDAEDLLRSKVDFLSVQVELLNAADPGFIEAAVKLHGIPDEESLKKARSILDGSREESYVFPEESVSPEEMVSIMRAELEAEGIDWQCVLSDRIVPKITVSGKDHTIYVNSRIKYTPQEIERLKVHEIKVHIYRGVNGAMQPLRIFAEGLAGYNETEEGLAIVAEEASGCLREDTRQMKLYAGRALCADLCMKNGFYETFNALREFFPDDIAYRLTERGKRGLTDTSAKGGLTKGFHYISGWLRTQKFVERGGDLSILYVGKTGVDDVDVVNRLLKEGILKPPRHVPEFIGKK